MAADANGKLLIGGDPTYYGGVGLQRLLPNGSVDTSFGSDGEVRLSFIVNPQPSHAAVITAIAIQPDGKIVIAGLDGVIEDNDYGLTYSSQTPFIARLNASGTLDTSFGSGGEVAAPIAHITGIAVLPSGKIIYGGASGGAFEAARLNANGTVDTTYDVTGLASFYTSDVDSHPSFNVESDGKVIIGGGDFESSAIVRFTAGGRPDPSFGLAGRATPIPIYSLLLASAVLPDDKILIEFDGPSGDLLERLNVNGTVDTTFGVKGRVAIPYIGQNSAAIAVDSMGRILLNGTGTVTRYESNGALDKSFGTNGVSSPGSGFTMITTAITLQSSGRIVLTGYDPELNPRDPIVFPLVARFLGSHVVLTAGTSAVTTGTTNVADPRLIGKVIASQTLNFNSGSGASAVNGQVQEWVEKETVSGTLDFYFRIVTASGSAAGISSLLASDFSSFQTYVDYRPDSTGTIAPVTASRSTDGQSITFHFLPSPNGDGLVTAGTSSYALFVKTDATQFNKLGKVVLNNTIDLDGYEPVG